MWVVTQTSLRRQFAVVPRYLVLGIFGRQNRFRRMEQKEEGVGKGSVLIRKGVTSFMAVGWGA